MIFAYGNYVHQNNEVSTVFRQSTLYDQRGNRRGLRKSIELSGVLHGDSQADLTIKLNELDAAYSQDGQNAILFLDNGTTQTHHKIINNDTLTGVRVVKPPSFSPGDGAEYSTFRSYTAILEADFVGDSEVVSFEETVTVVGTGGPRFAYLETLEGLPVRQTVNLATLVRMTQSGSAVNYLSYPFAPGPLLASLEDVDQRTITRRSPKQQGRVLTDFPISWSYKFTSDVAISAIPNEG
jgi:hypothetical protein